MPKELRAQLHETYAGWLERSTEDAGFERNEILGYHLEQAYLLRRELGQPDAGDLGAHAAVWLLAAANGAMRRADFPAAVSLFERAVDLLPADDPQRLEALPELAHALTRRGEFERAQAILRSAIDEARRVGSDTIEAYARLDLNRLRSQDRSRVEGGGRAERGTRDRRRR